MAGFTHALITGMFGLSLVAQKFNFNCETIEDELNCYAEEFKESHKQYTGVEVDFDITWDIRDFWEFSAAAHASCDPTTGTVIIARASSSGNGGWDTWNNHQKRKVVYHELGHTILFYLHLGGEDRLAEMMNIPFIYEAENTDAEMDDVLDRFFNDVNQSNRNCD